MKKRNFLIGLIFGITFFFNGLMPIVSAIEKNEYLSYGEGSIFYPDVEVGDVVYWSFETSNDEFNVRVSSDVETISENETSDSGNYIVSANTTYLMFINLDNEWLREGFIKIEISINVPLSTSNDPEPFDPDPIIFNPIIYIISGIFAIILVWVVVNQSKRKKERIARITHDSKVGEKYKIKPTTPEPKMLNKYCQNCGTKVLPTTSFCVNCGQNLSD